MQTLKQLTDEVLIELYLQGNTKAFEVLLKRHKNKVFGRIFHLVKDRDLAEDLFQETFFKVIRELKKKKYTEEGKFLPWVMRIANNLVIDYFRKSAKMPMVRDRSHEEGEEATVSVLQNLVSDEILPSDKMKRKQTVYWIKKAIEELPSDQKLVLKLRVYEELSFKEIAEITNVSINTALGRMRYALINLKKILEKNNAEIIQ
ncbi:MAG: RNA polymerase subunit sigma-24 [Vicingaceae bacterium]|nr:MAG: RNA polymerase subunit sigma-24 [Vicingaceae bacterium]